METFTDENAYIAQYPETEDELLAFTTKIRVLQVNKLLEGQGVSTSDHKAHNSLEKYLAGIDRQVVGSKRLDAQAKLGTGMSDLANSLDHYLQNGKAASSGFQRHPDLPEDQLSLEGPSNLKDLNIAPRDFIEGQLTSSGTNIDIEQIMASGRQKQREI